MDDLLDMIIADESPSQVSDKIKELLFAKSSERIDNFRPTVSANMFGQNIEDLEDVEDVEEYKQEEE
jgi:hypothetical protein